MCRDVFGLVVFFSVSSDFLFVCTLHTNLRLARVDLTESTVNLAGELPICPIRDCCLESYAPNAVRLMVFPITIQCDRAFAAVRTLSYTPAPHCKLIVTCPSFARRDTQTQLLSITYAALIDDGAVTPCLICSVYHQHDGPESFAHNHAVIIGMEPKSLALECRWITVESPGYDCRCGIPA